MLMRPKPSIGEELAVQQGGVLSPHSTTFAFFLPFIIEWPQSYVATSAIWRHNFTTPSFDFGV